MLENSVHLPPLREELKLEALAPVDGEQKRWRLYDPIRHQFYVLGEADVTLMTLWKLGTVGRLKCALNNMSLKYDEQQLNGLLEFFTVNELLAFSAPVDLQGLHHKFIQSETMSFGLLLAKIRNIKLPLFFVAPILALIEPILNVASRKLFWLIWLFLTLFGVYFSLRQWDDFIHTASGFYSLSGAFSFALTLVVLKFFHELGHAYFARKYGCQVGRLGIATFFMMPMLYTEMDDVTRLQNKQQKMMVAAGGIFVELLIAGLATFVWAVTSEGVLRELAFVVATTCWLTSVLLNLNPFAKYDGYYLLSDYLGIENLQSKSLALAGRYLDKCVLGTPINSSEQGHRVGWMVAFGIGTWAYQVLIITLISAFFYLFFFPALGLVWLITMMGMFVVTPMVKRLASWKTQMKDVSPMRKLTLWFLLLVLLGLIFVPMNPSLKVAGISRNKQLEVIYAPTNSQIAQWHVTPNSVVKAGQLLVTFTAPELLRDLDTTKVMLALSKQQLDSIAGDPNQRAFTQVLQQEYQELQTQMQGLERQIERLTWRASFAGRLVDVPEQIGDQQWVSPDQQLGRIVAEHEFDGLAYISEKALKRIKPSAGQAYFYPNDASWPMQKVQIVDFSNSAVTSITPDVLSSEYGGPIASQESDNGKIVPEQALHSVRFLINDYQHTLASSIQLQGHLVIKAEAISLASMIGTNVWQLVLTELRR